MIADADIVSAIVAHRKPIERKRLAGLLHLDDDAELAATLGRLTREGHLDRIPKPGPGKNTVFVYWPTAAGKATTHEQPAVVALETGGIVTEDANPAPATTTNEKDHPMTTRIEAAEKREKILRFIAAKPGMTSSAIAAAIEVDRDVVDKMIDTLRKRGEIRRLGEKRPFGYEAAGDGTVPAKRPKPAKPARRPKEDRRIAPAARPAPTPTGFRVALTSDDTLLMERPATKERVELQPDEISVLTAFLRRLDQAAPL